MQQKIMNKQSYINQLIDLFYIEMTNWRWSWKSMLITGAMAPLLGIVGLGIFAKDSGAVSIAYVFAGNLVLSLMFGNMEKMNSHFVFIKQNGTLDYFSTLPIHKYIVILSSMFAFLLLSLPALLVTLLAGALYLKVHIVASPLLILIIPLCSIPLGGIGALIGTISRSPEESGSITMLITFIMTGLGPVMIPPDRLPGIIVKLGFASPATYAASAMRQVLLGPVTNRLYLDVAVLTSVSILIFWMIGRKLDWRQE